MAPESGLLGDPRVQSNRNQLKGTISMKRLFGAIALVCILSAATLYAGEWTGYISDSNCAAKGEKAEHAGCAKSCISRGASAVLVAQGKVYTLDNQTDAKKLAGEKVVVKGTANDDGTAIKVESIAKAEN
jgi:hypothetical protein